MVEPDRRTRAFPRCELNAYVDYTGSEVMLYHRIENISLGGICVTSANVEDVGTIVDLVINFPDLQLSLSTRAEVVWSNREPPMDMGLRYIDLDASKREKLKAYIERVKR